MLGNNIGGFTRLRESAAANLSMLPTKWWKVITVALGVSLRNVSVVS